MKNADHSGRVVSNSSNPKYQVLITVGAMFVRFEKATKSETEETRRESGLYNAMEQKKHYTRKKRPSLGNSPTLL
jgi:hypothetical protein